MRKKKLGIIRRTFKENNLLAILGLVIFIPFSCNNTSSKFDQYYIQGKQLYLKHCSNCHQRDGSGLGRVYPPLDSSDFMDKGVENVLCLIRYGINGEIFVNGTQYNQPMPGVSTLSDLEIAEIATYIYNTWSHKKGIVEVKETSAILQNCDPSR